MKQIKRIPALVLAIVCVLALCIGMAFAETEANVTDVTGPVITDIKLVSFDDNKMTITAKVFDEESQAYGVPTVNAYFTADPVSEKDPDIFSFKVMGNVSNGIATFVVDLEQAKLESSASGILGTGKLHSIVTLEKIVALDFYDNMSTAVPNTEISAEFYPDGRDYIPPVAPAFTCEQENTKLYYNESITVHFEDDWKSVPEGAANYYLVCLYFYDETGKQMKSVTKLVEYTEQDIEVPLEENCFPKGVYTIKVKIIDEFGRSAMSDHVITFEQMTEKDLDLGVDFDSVKVTVNGKELIPGEVPAFEDSLDHLKVHVEAVISDLPNGFYFDSASAIFNLYDDVEGALTDSRRLTCYLTQVAEYADGSIKIAGDVTREIVGCKSTEVIKDKDVGLVNGRYSLKKIYLGYKSSSKPQSHGYFYTNTSSGLEVSDLQFDLYDKFIPVGAIAIKDEAGELVETAALSIEQDAILSQTTLFAEVFPENAYAENVVWSSSNPMVAIVLPDEENPNKCVVKAVADGTATIYAKAADQSEVDASVDVTVSTVTVKSIKLSESAVKLTATGLDPNPAFKVDVVEILPANAKDLGYTWSSSDPSIAVVAADSDGMVVATGIKGSCDIICKSNDGAAVATCKVTVDNSVVVTDVVLNKKNVTMIQTAANPAPSAQLTAVVAPEDAAIKTLLFTSDDPAVATVDQTGLVTAVAAGKTTIRATAVNGISAECEVTVLRTDVEEIKLDQASISLAFSADTPKPVATVKATVLPFDAKQDVEWVIEDSDVAIVKDGVVTAFSDGETKLYAKATDASGVQSAPITVKVSTVKVAGLSLNKAQLDLVVTVDTPNPSESLIATVNPSNAYNQKLIWTISDESIAIVRDGKVTAQKTGVAILTVKSAENDAVFCQCIINVTGKTFAKSISLDKAEVELEISTDSAETAKLSAQVAPSTAMQDVEWLSEDETVATVKADGTVTAVAAGTCRIWALAKDGSAVKSAPCKVTVSNRPVSVITLNKEQVTLYATAEDPTPSETLVASVLPANAINTDVRWTTSNPDVVTVNNGKLMAKSVGSAVVSCIACDGSGVSASCFVAVTGSIVVTKVELDKEVITLNITKADPQPCDLLKAKVYPTTALITNVNYVSSDEAVAVVDEKGMVYAVGTGTCVITALSADPGARSDSYDTCTVIVTKNRLDSIRFTRKLVTMRITRKNPAPSMDVERYLRVAPAGIAYRLKWTSSDRSVATVKNGIVSAKKAGTCYVTVTVRGSDLQASIKVKVR